MDLESYLGKEVRVTFLDGVILSGRIIDYTTSEDNDDEGEYLVIKPQSGKLKDRSVAFFEHEIESIIKK
ncbi:hypothetical protein [Enterococcus casseliflavus]|uniref:hypothetical protein n=1 Tax=Enterococcus casseliflavus TaxID=37734 RepID=UPI0035DDA4DB